MASRSSRTRKAPAAAAPRPAGCATSRSGSACRSGRSTARCTGADGSATRRGRGCSRPPPTLGYRPNLAARYLSARKTADDRGLPAARARAVLRRRAGPASPEPRAPFAPGGLRLAWHDYPRLGVGEADGASRRARHRSGRDHRLARRPRAARAAALAAAAVRRVPLVCVTTDAPGRPRLSAISVDPRTSGALVGELIARFIDGPGAVGVVSGSLATTDHAGKVEGLRHACLAFAPRLRVGRRRRGARRRTRGTAEDARAARGRAGPERRLRGDRQLGAGAAGDRPRDASSSSWSRPTCSRRSCPSSSGGWSPRRSTSDRGRRARSRSTRCAATWSTGSSRRPPSTSPRTW